MNLRKTAQFIIVAILLTAGCVLADNINGIDFVTIGDPGNDPDPHGDAERNGNGSVGYQYRISQKEITIAQFEASPIVDANANWWNDGTRTVGQDAPVSFIQWHQAARYCNWLTSGDASDGAYTIVGNEVTDVMSRAAILATGTLHFVLPTEDEWYKAAFYTGSGYSRYANGTGDAPLIGLGGAMYDTNTVWQVGTGLLEANNNTYDMMGNVWEWTETPFDGTLTPGAVVTNNMILRGGDFLNNVVFIDADTDSNAKALTSYRNVGFRVVAIPEPGTMSLMGLTSVSLFATRSIRRRKRLGQSLLPVRQELWCDRFETMEAMEYDLAMDEEATVADLWFAAAMDYLSTLGQQIRDGYKYVDKQIWSWLVAVHERRLAKRIAFRNALKRKALNGFDAFLERVDEIAHKRLYDKRRYDKGL